MDVRLNRMKSGHIVDLQIHTENTVWKIDEMPDGQIEITMISGSLTDTNEIVPRFGNRIKLKKGIQE